MVEKQDKFGGEIITTRKTANCVLKQKCKYEGACGAPILILPGYREEDMSFDNDVKFKDWVFDNHDTYTCELPHDECEHDVFCVADALDKETNRIGSPANLVGFCYGGNVAQAYASTRPEKVRKMALITTTDVKRVRNIVEQAFKLKDLNEVKKVDFKVIQDKITAPTYIYNCIGDRLIGGNPPSIKNAQVREDFFCVHGIVKKSIKGEVERFFNKR